MTAPRIPMPRPDKASYSRLETDLEFRQRIYKTHKIDVADWCVGEKLDYEAALHHPYPRRRIVWIES